MNFFQDNQRLKEIEKRLLEIDEEKVKRKHYMKENPGEFQGIDGYIEADEIKFLDVEKEQLQLERQFILDRRNNWKSRVLWNVVVPIVVTIITTFALLQLNLRQAV